MRRLATIKIIADLQPIPNKDLIELAFIDGWQVIVKKGEYKIGEETVFCEIDSVLPSDNPVFEFMSKYKYRVKTIKLGGVLSQGICFPINILPPNKYEINEDVTEVLGIRQYEKTKDNEREITIPKSKNKFMNFLFRFEVFRNLFITKEYKEFPSFISKTDETRIQDIPYILKTEGISLIATEKIDGQSGTFTLERIKPKYFWQKEKFDYAVCSRNRRLKHKDMSKSYWKVSEKYNIEQKLKELIKDNDWVAIQGECIDTKVQGNKYGVTEADLYVFNIKFPNKQLGPIEVNRLCIEIGLKSVPIKDSLIYLNNMTINDVLEYATFKSALADITAEGIVFRTEDSKISFRAVSPKFLIKHDE